MRITFWLGIFCWILVYVVWFVILYLALWTNETRIKKWNKLIVYVACISVAFGAARLCTWFIHESPEVISVGKQAWTISSWRFHYERDGKRYPVKTGKTYLYVGSETDTTFVLTPVYYHINPDSVGRKVPDRMPTDTIYGRFVELPHKPLYVLSSPDSVHTTGYHRERAIVYYLGRPEDSVPDYYLRLEQDVLELNWILKNRHSVRRKNSK